jgi:acetyl-CoA synthetase
MSTLESILKETRSFPPSDDFRHKATVSGMEAYNALCEQADDSYLAFWGDLARELITWKNPSHGYWMTAMRLSSNGLTMVC